MTDHTETLSERLRFHRRSLGWSQEKLAQQAGCYRNQVSSIERGHNPTIETVGAIADAMGVSMAVMLTPLSKAQRKTL